MLEDLFWFTLFAILGYTATLLLISLTFAVEKLVCNSHSICLF